MSWDVILPFLRPLEGAIQDPDVTDILINAFGRVFIEKFGRLEEVPGVRLSEKSLQIAIRHIARVLGGDVSEEKPLLDARLPDGSRVAAVLTGCSVDGTSLAIRKFQSKRYTADELVRVGTLTAEVLQQLRTAIELRRNILIAGGTGSGKTTLLNALAAFIAANERIILIEDPAEIQIQQEDLVRFEARHEQPQLPAVTMRHLLAKALRFRPDRIVVGEVRTGEAFDLLQALNTGHCALSTIHANSAQLAVSRFVTCVLMSGIQLPYKAIGKSIGESLDMVVHLGRTREGNRVVTELLRIRGYDSAEDRYEFDTLYQRAA
jgi:pilus assembly protein CpaF